MLTLDQILLQVHQDAFDEPGDLPSHELPQNRKRWEEFVMETEIAQPHTSPLAMVWHETKYVCPQKDRLCVVWHESYGQWMPALQRDGIWYLAAEGFEDIDPQPTHFMQIRLPIQTEREGHISLAAFSAGSEDKAIVDMYQEHASTCTKCSALIKAAERLREKAQR
jgi:hypothetical protein